MKEYTLKDFQADIHGLSYAIAELQNSHVIKKVYGVPRGGIPLAIALAGKKDILNLKLCSSMNEIDDTTIIVDDIVDSGKTYHKYSKKFPHNFFVTLFLVQRQNTVEINPGLVVNHHNSGDWINFWWEKKEDEPPEGIKDNVIRMLEFIGEDPTRDGLKDTPKRVQKALLQMTSGYHEDIPELFTVFDSGYDNMVVLKDISFYSLCEHHMLPFFGVAHVGYIPNEKNGQIIGISKLARLVRTYAKRLQVQERIGDQVVKALKDYLDVKGAGCVIEASHMCMRARGVSDPSSNMVTSSLTGVFKDQQETREEFLRLIGK